MATRKRINCGLSRLQTHLYQSIVQRDLEIINNKTEVTDATLLGTVMQLKQCCCHPYLFDGMEKEQSQIQRSTQLNPENVGTHHLIKNCGKLFILDKLITKIKSEQTNRFNKILLCSQIREIRQWFEQYCNVRGIFFYTITDKTKDNPNNDCAVILHHTSNQGMSSCIDYLDTSQITHYVLYVDNSQNDI